MGSSKSLKYDFTGLVSSIAINLRIRGSKIAEKRGMPSGIQIKSWLPEYKVFNFTGVILGKTTSDNVVLCIAFYYNIYTIEGGI